MPTTIWKGHITFGLISLPVRLSAAARSETISFNQLHKPDNSRVKQVLYCIAEDKPVPRSDLVKGYEYEEGRYVVVDEEDIKKIQPKSAKVIEVLEFLEARDLDSVYLESSYYLQPEEAGEKAYTVLFVASSARAALAWLSLPCTTANTSSSSVPARRATCCTPCTTRTKFGRARSFAPTVPS
jgi:DNA end-binding protein Ku